MQSLRSFLFNPHCYMLKYHEEIVILNITLTNQKVLTLSVYHSNKAVDRKLPTFQK